MQSHLSCGWNIIKGDKCCLLWLFSGEIPVTPFFSRHNSTSPKQLFHPPWKFSASSRTCWGSQFCWIARIRFYLYVILLYLHYHSGTHININWGILNLIILGWMPNCCSAFDIWRFSGPIGTWENLVSRLSHTPSLFPLIFIPAALANKGGKLLLNFVWKCLQLIPFLLI